MSINMRRGNDADFDPTKLTAGEPAVLNTSKRVAIAFADGTVRYLRLEDEEDETGTPGKNGEPGTIIWFCSNSLSSYYQGYEFHIPISNIQSYNTVVKTPRPGDYIKIDDYIALIQSVTDTYVITHEGILGPSLKV